ncbi:hypothetical protein BDF20DRAFT_831152 [Mycotypha africana]|uniref:uncharacterized protein n=1 Tax=Mycotypha africana TaxID=64632 RepID=UPI0023010EE0|nr:uncharacterized protein BDF20DRAFT_831152 [Mycotypha africana]KAI8991071.1 hypothetical protein BDF20DRAFT_831152 [Mycotypha africana]
MYDGSDILTILEIKGYCGHVNCIVTQYRFYSCVVSAIIEATVSLDDYRIRATSLLIVRDSEQSVSTLSIPFYLYYELHCTFETLRGTEKKDFKRRFSVFEFGFAESNTTKRRNSVNCLKCTPYFLILSFFRFVKRSNKDYTGNVPD